MEEPAIKLLRDTMPEGIDEGVKERVEQFSEKYGYLINTYAEWKIEWMGNHLGVCYCDCKNRICPCSQAHDEIEAWGCCMCQLFVTAAKLKKIKKYKEKKESLD